MAFDFSEGFEGGSNGATITSGNTNFNGGVVGTTATFDSSTFAHGSLSAKLVTSSNTCVLQRTFTASNQRTMRKYMKILALPASGNLVIANTKLSTGVVTAQVRISSGGLLQIRDQTTLVATGTKATGANTWFRFEWQIDGVGATQKLDIYVGANVDGNTPDETISGAYTNGNFDLSNTGPNTSGSYTVWVDDVYEDSALVTIGSANPPAGSIFNFTHFVTIGS